jgi:hypothetical protein
MVLELWYNEDFVLRHEFREPLMSSWRRALPWMRRIILAIPANKIPVEIGFGIHLLDNVLLRFARPAAVERQRPVALRARYGLFFD